MKYVLILIAMGSDGAAVGTSQAIFADKDTCEAAGRAAQEAGGTYSWSKNNSGGFGPRIIFKCVPQGEP